MSFQLQASGDLSVAKITDEADTAYNFGASYELGVGVEQDNAEAAKWFIAAAEEGYAAAYS